MSRPRRKEGNKRCFCPFVRPSVAYIANNSRTQRLSVSKFGRSFPTLDRTRIAVSRSNGQRSGLEAGGGILCRRPNPFGLSLVPTDDDDDDDDDDDGSGGGDDDDDGGDGGGDGGDDDGGGGDGDDDDGGADGGVYSRTQVVLTGQSQLAVSSRTVKSSPSVERKSLTTNSSTRIVSTTPAGQQLALLMSRIIYIITYMDVGGQLALHF